MNKLRTIIILAAGANLITFLLYRYAVNQSNDNSDTAFYFTLAIMVLWLATFLTALDQAKSKNLFSTKLCFWAVLIIQFCTPFPLLSVYSTLNSRSTINRSETENKKTNETTSNYGEDILGRLNIR